MRKVKTRWAAALLLAASMVVGSGCSGDDERDPAGGEDAAATDVGNVEDTRPSTTDGGGADSGVEDSGVQDSGVEDSGGIDVGGGDAGADSGGLEGCDPAGSPYGGGTGSETDPYTLCAPAHWFELGPDEGVHYVLVTDLDFAGETYAPIADFGGVLDGGGHAVRNVTVDGVATGALFDQVFGATVRDLRVEGIEVTATNFAAGLVHRVVGSRPSGSFDVARPSTFERVTVNGTIEATADLGKAAGIVGLFERGTASDLSFEGAVSGEYASGAIFNLSRDATARRVVVDADVVGALEASGLAHVVLGTLEEAAAHGTATGDGRVSGLIADLVYIGAPTVADVYSDMDLTLTLQATLGTAGVGGDIYRAAGIVVTPRFGRDRNGSIERFYFGGTITTTGTPPSGFQVVTGGLFACWGGYTGCNGDWIGEGCYWDSESSGESEPGGGATTCTGLSSAEIRSPSQTPELAEPTWQKSSGALPRLAFEAP